MTRPLGSQRRRVALAGALAAAAVISCGGETTITDPPPNFRGGYYRTVTTADLLSDTRLRENAPLQTQGGFSSLVFGDESGGALNLALMDSSVVFLDSIPAGSEIVACTLWVKLNRLSLADGDSVGLDLWSVSEPWDENSASWNQRTAAAPWSTPGSAGAVVAPGHIAVKRVDVFRFEWRIGGSLWDTLTLESARAVPIPLTAPL
ncbi:MAG TPA: hypothetical protein VLB27_03675, partial [candidate division Zixibacteria bacterium]|nr:hypothetical protein [candidate division Zixibacteria bacterium]